MRLLPLAPTRSDYVALGDGLSAEAPDGGGAARLLWKNQDVAFPDWHGRDLSTRFPGARLVVLAEEGASAATVRFVQIPRLKALGIAPAIATLTVGGAELWRTRGDAVLTDAAHTAFSEHLRAALRALRALGGESLRLSVATVPDPSDGVGDLPRAGVLASPDSLRWLARFNRSVGAAAAEVGAAVVDLHGAFLGHGLQAGDPSGEEFAPARRELYFRRDAALSLWGAGALRALWWEWIEGRELLR